ncbi:hypothetical protein F2P56_035824 [Juglans regia]|uniref:Endonuclease/exonuclease/phosphatase domain-containing protein n=2 Tax=Juglans regia TaxID=51240 RepID=A0A833TA60_JUGRE|nr:uncharacterized protein LOC108989790 [Juglans regia]KAF5443252.1 hypothetical protein F2P56_035824 [Juglans regia]
MAGEKGQVLGDMLKSKPKLEEGSMGRLEKTANVPLDQVEETCDMLGVVDSGFSTGNTVAKETRFDPSFDKRPQKEGKLQLLQAIKPGSAIGWVCVGDFNEILSYGEKWGGALRPSGQIEAFRDVVEGCELCDMGSIGNKFTWTNGRYGEAFTKERLDRAFCNATWAKAFPNSEVFTLPTVSSNHYPLLVTIEESQAYRNKKDKPFRFEANWALREDYQNLVEESWLSYKESENKLDAINEGLNQFKQKLLLWNK